MTDLIVTILYICGLSAVLVAGFKLTDKEGKFSEWKWSTIAYWAALGLVGLAFSMSSYVD